MSAIMSLRRALDNLEAYAVYRVESGGTDPAHDADWQARTARVVASHNAWTEEVRIPHAHDNPHWRVHLENWVRNLDYHAADQQRVAQWLCHIHVVRSLVDWPDAVFEPLEPWWFPNVRPWMIEVPRCAWDAASGEQYDDSWLIRVAATLVHYEPTLARFRPFSRPCHRESDLIGTLPGILVKRWLKTTGRWPEYAPQITSQVDEFRTQDAEPIVD